MAEVEKQKHFVLVHGLCHGAWSWHKLKPRLEAAGHKVTALDLAASGIDMRRIEEVQSFDEYNEPLFKIMRLLQPQEKVILIGHSLGGLNLALAMENFPNNISVAVFVTAFMPDTEHQPSYVLDQLTMKYYDKPPAEAWLDTQFVPFGKSGSDSSLMAMLFGHKFLSKLYQLSPVEDLELAKLLARPGSFFLTDLKEGKKFSNENFGKVKRVYVLCGEDTAIPINFQQWMIQNNPVEDVLDIKDADHMPMNSKTQQLSDCLLEIAHKYS